MKIYLYVQFIFSVMVLLFSAFNAARAILYSRAEIMLLFVLMTFLVYRFAVVTSWKEIQEFKTK